MLERNEEIQVLESMMADFIETKNRVDKTIELQTRVVDYCNKLIYLMYEKDEQMSTDSIREYTVYGAFLIGELNQLLELMTLLLDLEKQPSSETKP